MYEENMPNESKSNDYKALYELYYNKSSEYKVTLKAIKAVMDNDNKLDTIDEILKGI